MHPLQDWPTNWFKASDKRKYPLCQGTDPVLPVSNASQRMPPKTCSKVLTGSPAYRGLTSDVLWIYHRFASLRQERFSHSQPYDLSYLLTIVWFCFWVLSRYDGLLYDSSFCQGPQGSSCSVFGCFLSLLGLSISESFAWSAVGRLSAFFVERKFHRPSGPVSWWAILTA